MVVKCKLCNIQFQFIDGIINSCFASEEEVGFNSLSLSAWLSRPLPGGGEAASLSVGPHTGRVFLPGEAPGRLGVLGFVPEGGIPPRSGLIVHVTHLGLQVLGAVIELGHGHQVASHSASEVICSVIGQPLSHSGVVSHC